MPRVVSVGSGWCWVGFGSHVFISVAILVQTFFRVLILMVERLSAETMGNIRQRVTLPITDDSRTASIVQRGAEPQQKAARTELQMPPQEASSSSTIIEDSQVSETEADISEPVQGATIKVKHGSRRGWTLTCIGSNGCDKVTILNVEVSHVNDSEYTAKSLCNTIGEVLSPKAAMIKGSLISQANKAAVESLKAHAKALKAEMLSVVVA